MDSEGQSRAEAITEAVLLAIKGLPQSKVLLELQGELFSAERAMVVRDLIQEALLSEKEQQIEQLLLQNAQLRLRADCDPGPQLREKHQSELDKLRKVLELEMRKNRELRHRQSHLFSSELKKQLDVILGCVQRDYILKSTHEAFLQSELAKVNIEHQSQRAALETRISRLEAELAAAQEALGQSRHSESSAQQPVQLLKEYESRFKELQNQAEHYQDVLRKRESPQKAREEASPSPSRFERMRNDFDKQLKDLRTSLSARRQVPAAESERTAWPQRGTSGRRKNRWARE